MEIKNPTIKTLSVNIRLIQIDKKAFTISVFNQFYSKSPINESNEIAFEIWGKVHYKGGDYVVFIENGNLRKFQIPHKWSKIEFDFSLLKPKVEIKSDDYQKFFYSLEVSFNRILNQSTFGSTYESKFKELCVFLSKNKENFQDEINIVNTEIERLELAKDTYNNSIDKLRASEQLFISI